MVDDRIQFHNVGECRPLDDRDGYRLQRVPESVRNELNEGCADRMCHPAGVELRFVPEGSVELTLSVEPCRDVESSSVEVFWGPLQSPEPIEIGTEPTTVELSTPESVAALDPDVLTHLRFDPRVCRVCLPGEHRGGHVFFHGVEGDLRPPTADDLPDRRYLAYGTSITEGERASADHLTYVDRTAARLGADLINLGSCGTAYCDVAMAEHIAGEEWDVATLALSVNMVGHFPVDIFRERAGNMVGTVAGANPEKPVAAVTIYTNASDVRTDAADDEECEPYREALREVVAESPHDNVHLIEGTDVLPSIAGLTTDLVHPGDGAMATMAENLAPRLADLLDE